MRAERTIEQKMRLVERLLLAFIHGSIPSATLFPKRGGEVHPSCWAISVRVPTDHEREQLRRDWNVDRKLRTTLARAGYPRYAITSVNLYVQSEETQQREFEKHGIASFM